MFPHSFSSLIWWQKRSRVVLSIFIMVFTSFVRYVLYALLETGFTWLLILNKTHIHSSRTITSSKAFQQTRLYILNQTTIWSHQSNFIRDHTLLLFFFTLRNATFGQALLSLLFNAVWLASRLSGLFFSIENHRCHQKKKKGKHVVYLQLVLQILICTAKQLVSLKWKSF